MPRLARVDSLTLASLLEAQNQFCFASFSFLIDQIDRSFLVYSTLRKSPVVGQLSDRSSS